MALSCHPTVVDGRLEPRHTDQRAFAGAGGDVALLSGALTRVALDGDAHSRQLLAEGRRQGHVGRRVTGERQRDSMGV